MEFFDTIKQVKSNWEPYKKWEIEQQKKQNQNEELRKKYPPTEKELDHAKEYGRTLVNTINIMDQHSIDKAEDASFVVNNALALLHLASLPVGGIIGAIAGRKASKKTKIYFEVIGVITSAMITSVFSNIYGASIEKQASRIARFQTRKEELNDYKNFVIYNKDQIKQAEKIAETLPEVEDKSRNLTLKNSLNPVKTFSKAKKTTDDLRKNYKEYEKWKNKYLEEEKINKERFRTLTPSNDELSKAQKERDKILGTIKKIENSSLNYMMDMRLAILTIQVGITALGISVGLLGMKSIDLITKMKKNISENKTGGSKFLSLNVLPIAVSMVLIGPIIKLYKDAARIGRYKAKREMLSNPANFVVYDDEQRKKINAESPKEQVNKGFLFTLKKDLNSVKKLKKDYDEYHNYLKTKHKDELKLQEALKQVEITEEQKKEALKLQKEAFHSFEKMDEKAQRFTDDTDAAVDITRNIIASLLSASARIFSLSMLFKKLDKNSIKEISKFQDAMKALYKFKNSDIIKITAPLFIPSIVNLPITIKGIQIKKESGKIGVMTAMNDLEDPKNFLDEDLQK